MTNLEALQSMTEYSNDNLLAKILLDRGVATGGTYAAGNAENIDLCAASLYMTLATHPEIKEGSSMTKYDSKQLIIMAEKIEAKYGTNAAVVDGDGIW